ncbi:MAG: YqhA family protein [Bacteroidota bacterium]
MQIQNLFGYLLKIIAFFAVFGVVLLSFGVLTYSFFEVSQMLKMVSEGYSEGEKVVPKALKAIDLVLIGIVFFIIGTGLFELFIKPIDNLPEWFQIKNIDQLKGMLIKVLVVVMGVSYTGRVVTWDGQTDLLGYGVGLGVVIFAMSYFLKVKNDKEEMDDEHDED